MYKVICIHVADIRDATFTEVTERLAWQRFNQYKGYVPAIIKSIKIIDPQGALIAQAGGEIKTMTWSDCIRESFDP